MNPATNGAQRVRRVLITTHLFDAAAIRFLESHNCEVVTPGLAQGVQDTALTRADLADLLRDVDAWIVGNVAVTRELLACFPRVRVVARRGVGYDGVDLQAARDLGRVVTIAPGWNVASVADHTLALMLAVARRVVEGHCQMQKGDWAVLAGGELYRKTVGVIGLGRIGRAVAQRLTGFEARILAYDAQPDLTYARMHAIEVVDLPTVLKQSDYLSLHLPLTAETRNIIDANALHRMKPTAILVNTARGGLVDEDALLQALKGGQIAGAGLDVFRGEKDPARLAVAKELLSLPNLVASSHSAGASREGLDRGNLITAQSVIAVLDGGSPPAECLVVDGRRSA